MSAVTAHAVLWPALMWSAVAPHVGAVAGATSLSTQFWLTSLGAFGVFVVLVAETGLLLGGDLAGRVSAVHPRDIVFDPREPQRWERSRGGARTDVRVLSLPWVLRAAAAGALVGAQMGFVVGCRGGRALLVRTRNRHLHRAILCTERLLFRYGYRTAIVLARFLPVVRTVINPLAGMSSMPVRTFVLWQFLGGLAWSLTVTLAGYGLGSCTAPNATSFVLPVIGVAIGVSTIPIWLELLRGRRRKHHHDVR